jgi:hypothetical protein
MVLATLVLGIAAPGVLWAQTNLENPQPESFQSGIGLISGWVCEAARIDIEIDGTTTLQATYGTSRSDTREVCGDDGNNGFGLLFNWNLLGNGTHGVRVLRNGTEEVAKATFVVATLGLGEFPRGLSGNFTLSNFPQEGKNTRIQWQESIQNFAITNATGTSSGGGSTGPGANLENPQPGSFQSGIGLISGWVCTANRVDIEIDGTLMLQAAYGTARGDTREGCSDDGNNGFGLLVNWNLLGDGTHTVRALKDETEFARATFTVATLGLGEFPRGLSGSFTLPNFPQAGTDVRIRWQESAQDFVITGVSPSEGNPNLSGIWQLTTEGCLTDEDGEVICFRKGCPEDGEEREEEEEVFICYSPETVFIDVTQVGNQLFGSLTVPFGDLPATCNVTCTPARPNCPEVFELTGTVSGNSVAFTITQDQSFQIDCETCDFRAKIFEVQQYQGTIVGRTISGSASSQSEFSCEATAPCNELLECVDSTASGSFEVVILQ